MKRLTDIVRDITIVLWAGGLWIVGYMVTPLLFRSLADSRSLAGTLAGAMFHGIAWVGLACGAFLLLYELVNFKGTALKRVVFWVVLLMFAITLVQQFWLQPFVAALRSTGAPIDAIAQMPGRSFSFWHGTSSVLYLLESLLALALVLRARRSY